jgi:hypothetical protein
MPCRPIFESPQAELLPDGEGERYYANVSNRLEVAGEDGDTFCVAIAVPTVLFTLMRTLAVDPSDEVTLSLDEDARGFVFSMLHGDTLYDLWHYTRNTAPKWIFNPTYRRSVRL